MPWLKKSIININKLQGMLLISTSSNNKLAMLQGKYDKKQQSCWVASKQQIIEHTSCSK